MSSFFEGMMFDPKWYHYFFIVLLFPFSVFYGLLMLMRRGVSKKRDFGLPIVSVGNLIVGGSGKTPFVIDLASRYQNATVISRGYGRKSQGLQQVSHKGQILLGVEESGDEPMLMAQSLPHASVIVSEDRHAAIILAKAQGAEVIILDDGFNRVEIEKFEILLEPAEIRNILPFPAGAFREFWFMSKYADVTAKEGRDFSREVRFENLSEKMLLVTAISNPQRLDAYLPENVIAKLYLDDHAYFDEEMLKNRLESSGASTLLVTEKDAVKMQGFKLPLSIMKLKLQIKNDIYQKIDTYINKY